jgi:hypothetical protein
MEADSTPVAARQECSVAEEAQDPEIAPDVQGSAETQKGRGLRKVHAPLGTGLVPGSLHIPKRCILNPRYDLAGPMGCNDILNPRYDLADECVTL